ncbi:hypothetical protein NW844_08115 [Synechococcus sp. H55.2]|uniref:hypothetical protein n=1 Tax=Synechococcus sp. H55.2 TaxID=2964505 RepID=UPI0039C07774
MRKRCCLEQIAPAGRSPLPVLAWLTVGLLAGSLMACRQRAAPVSPELDPVRRHIGKDGTHFEASLGDTRALPPHFPPHLQLPNAAVVSSGQIWDRGGGLASLILQTSQPLEEIAVYYRRTLWGRGWDLLSDLEQANGIRTLVFESPPHPEQSLYQAVIQVGSPRRGPDQVEYRDILILLSTVAPVGKAQPAATASP